jgi:PKHD-type hydroxylase
MKGEWCYFRSYFDKATCEKIIKDCQIIPSQDAVVGLNSNVQTDYVNRRSKIRFINNGDWRFSYIFDALWKTAIQANADFFNIHVTKLDFIQIAEYDASNQGEYKQHHDVFWLNDDLHHHRKLSCIVQLSDPSTYQGGDFELVDTSNFPPANEIREQGTFIYFPSFFTHKANPVIRGTRYSIAAWFEGPKWR